MSKEERGHVGELLWFLRNKIAEDDTTVTGFKVGTNCGKVAGQTVMHAHVHLIPRRKGDTSEPRGGVRGVIPAKMSYSVARLQHLPHRPALGFDARHP